MLREIRGERVLEWRRGLGFQHLKTEERAAFKAGRDDAWALHLERHVPAGATTPPWLERLRARKKAELRERLLTTAAPEIAP